MLLTVARTHNTHEFYFCCLLYNDIGGKTGNMQREVLAHDVDRTPSGMCLVAVSIISNVYTTS